MSDNNSKAVLGCIGLVAVSFVSSIWNGYVLSILWGWFIVSALKVQPISIALAIGIAMTVKFMTYQYNGNDENGSMKSAMKATVFAIAYPLLALVAGYVVHSFV